MAAEVSLWVQTAPSLIAAISGLIGVVLGSWTTSSREAKRDLRNRSVDRAHLSTHLTIELERFVDGCFQMVNDYGIDENGQPKGENGSYIHTTDAPKFDPLTIDGNWKSLSSGMLDRVLLLPYQQEIVQASINAHSQEAFTPDNAEVFAANHFFYAKLGLEVLTLIDDLRLEAGLSKMERSSKIWSREARMKAAYEKRLAYFDY